MFSNLGFPELFVVAVLTVLVFGPERLPELARNAAKLLRRFRSEASRSITELREAADLGDIEQEVRSLRSELTGVREDLASGLRGQGGPSGGAAPDAKPVSPGGPTGTVEQPAGGPAPFDPEAT